MPAAPALRKYSITYPKCDLNKEHAAEILKANFTDIKAIVVAEEHHKDGDRHLHAYVEFKERRRRQTEAFDIEGHHGNVQGCRRTLDWIKYISKEDKEPFAEGIDLEAAKNKKASKLSVARASKLTYTELRKMVRPEMLQRTLAGLQLDKLLTAQVEDLEKPCGIWLCGPPGVGKSHDIRKYAAENKIAVYIKGHNKWWDGYSGEDIVLLDDIHPDQSGWITTFLKIWADAYKFNAETKGGTMCIRPKWIVVTSNFGPDDFAKQDTDGQAIRRRFIFEFVTRFDEAYEFLKEHLH